MSHRKPFVFRPHFSFSFVSCYTCWPCSFQRHLRRIHRGHLQMTSKPSPVPVSIHFSAHQPFFSSSMIFVRPPFEGTGAFLQSTAIHFFSSLSWRHTAKCSTKLEKGCNEKDDNTAAGKRICQTGNLTFKVYTSKRCLVMKLIFFLHFCPTKLVGLMKSGPQE